MSFKKGDVVRIKDPDPIRSKRWRPKSFQVWNDWRKRGLYEVSYVYRCGDRQGVDLKGIGYTFYDEIELADEGDDE